MQRFAHAHENKVHGAIPRRSVSIEHGHHLADDFARGEIPHDAHQARGAKGAAHGAAHLAGEAQRGALAVGHVNALYLLAIGKAERMFGGAVITGNGFGDFGPPQIRG